MSTKTCVLFIIAFFCFLLGRYSKEPNAYSNYRLNKLAEIDDPVERTENTIDISYLVNLERIKKKMNSVKMITELSCVAQQYTRFLTKKKKCVNQNIDAVISFGRKCGAPKTNAQIIACNESKTDTVINTWMVTDNRDVILNGTYTKFGCDEKNGYWVCVFAM